MEEIKIGQRWRLRNGEVVTIDDIRPWSATVVATKAAYFYRKDGRGGVYADGEYAGRGSSICEERVDLVELLSGPQEHRQVQMRLFEEMS